MDNGRYFLDALKLRILVFGELVRINAITRFARTLGTLLKSAVPLLETLEITSAVVGNKEICKRFIFGLEMAIQFRDHLAKLIISRTCFVG